MCDERLHPAAYSQMPKQPGFFMQIHTHFYINYILYTDMRSFGKTLIAFSYFWRMYFSSI